ncbi:MAG TPA: KEOPS complex kinase/ATPase Bud32 [Candidatus Bilamarchaeaceae archaeon]|nr:KEOPS complex kinase/ATPase Bud32 [Candidatus Bilamarchaeaceae archaeon]
MRGAEAVLRKGVFLGKNVVIKERKPKRYRVKALDEMLRIQRTRQEARLLHKAKKAGVPAPVVLAVDTFSITMTYIMGSRPRAAAYYRTAGKYLAQLHAADIIHGDYTPANLLVNKGRLTVIDFGLGFFSTDVEDKAIDVLTMLKSIGENEGKLFLQGYRTYKGYQQAMQRMEQVKGRVRYA